MKRIGRATAFACLLSLVSGAALAQGKVAVLNLEEAVFNTEEAKTQLNALRQTPDYTKNKKEAEELKKQRSNRRRLYKPLSKMPLVKTCRYKSGRQNGELWRHDETNRIREKIRPILCCPKMSKVRTRKKKQISERRLF